jgi:hypothetical protein
MEFNLLPLNGSVSDVLGEAGDARIESIGRYADYYQLTNLTPGAPVSIGVRSNQFDTYVVILNGETGEIVASDDNSWGGTNSLASFVPRFGDEGSYVIAVTSAGPNSAGSYQIGAFG